MALSAVVALTCLSLLDPENAVAANSLTNGAVAPAPPAAAAVLQSREQLPRFAASEKIEIFHLTRNDERPVFPDLKDGSGSALAYRSSRVGLGFRKAASRYDTDPDDAEGKHDATVFFGPGTREPEGDWASRALFPGGDPGAERLNSSGTVFAMPAVTSTLWDESTYMGVCNGITFDFLADWMLDYSQSFCHREQDLNVAAPEQQGRRESSEATPSHAQMISDAVVPSCTSHDFVYRAYRYLAYLGLAMRPLLPPKRVTISFNLAVAAKLPSVDWGALRGLQDGPIPPLNPSYFGANSIKRPPREEEESSGGLSTIAPISWVYAAEVNETGIDLEALKSQRVDVIPRAYVDEWYRNLSSCLGPHVQGIKVLKVNNVVAVLNQECIPQLPAVSIEQEEQLDETQAEKVREGFVYLDGRFYLRIALGSPALASNEGRMAMPYAQALPYDESSRVADWVAAVILVLFFLASLTAVLMRLGVFGYKYIDAETLRLGTLASRPDRTFFRDLIIHSPGFARRQQERMELEMQSKAFSNGKEQDAEGATTSELESLVM
eukprot:scaffold686_cov234-Pinguiococcus_pyrenoidosus.AAC.2